MKSSKIKIGNILDAFYQQIFLLNWLLIQKEIYILL